ncbi:unnamed protein product [Prorocentrum cordatum]|uniref:Uncharacterized protein n=1 Tax=Prorocentrum cordatum TaxID=2364126 RepID=A0ABN9RQM6_9DINO|nr:unnamed protein product [Polarella glacialis]
MSAPAPSRLKKRIGTPRGWRASSLRGPSRDAGRVPTRGARPRRDTSERPRGGRDAVSARARARMPGASCTAGARFTDQAGYCVLQAAAVLKLAPACPTSRGAESERKREKDTADDEGAEGAQEDDDGGHENQRGAALGERRAWVQRRLQRPPGRQARAGQRPGLAVRAPLRPLGTIPFSNYSCIHSSCRGTCPT